jgi:hypothetical protein
MEFPVNVWASVKILTTLSYNLIRNCQTHGGTIKRREHYLKKAEMRRKCTLQ